MSNFYALLIGINCYLPNRLPSGLYYKSLWGCVQDVLRMEEFFCRRLGIPAEHIITLTSSSSTTGEPPEPHSHWPTYENIVKAFQYLTQLAQPGDHVYIHYSGHGGRTLTTPAFYSIKGPNGIDETLVPMDLGNSEGRYLRDTELHYLITTMVDNGLIVTVVLDSCHAAGATRKPILNPALENMRGIGAVDNTPRLSESLVAPLERLKEVWETSTQPGTRAAKTGSGWLLEPRGYVLIAACGADEYANEVVFEGTEKSGALSYWLQDSLKQSNSQLTYKMLHQRILAKVRSQFPNQTPQLQGEGDRVVFGAEEAPSPDAVTVIDVNGEGRVVLNAGQAHGIRAGSQFSIYALYTKDFTKIDDRIAIVEINEVEGVSSYARVVTQFGLRTIESGCQGVLFEVGSIRLRRRVRLETNGKIVAGMEDVARELAQRPGGFVTLGAVDEPVDYRVTAVKEGTYVICDSSGIEVPNLRPAIRVVSQDAAACLVERLNHLARYSNVRALDNNDSQSPLSLKLGVEIAAAPADFRPGDIPDPQSLKTACNVVSLNHGDWCFLRIKNNYSQVLNITVLNLQPDWGITQIYPAGSGAFEAVGPDRELILPLHMSLPPNYESGTDIIKVFATLETTSFKWLELPALDRPDVSERGAPATPWEQFLSMFASEKIAARHAFVPAAVNAEWVAHQVEVEIRKDAAIK